MTSYRFKDGREHVVHELADGSVAVITFWPDGESDHYVYRDMAAYKHNLKLARNAGSAHQGLLK